MEDKMLLLCTFNMADFPSLAGEKKKPSRSSGSLFSTASCSDYDYILKRAHKSIDRRRKDDISLATNPKEYGLYIGAHYVKPLPRDLMYGSKNMEDLSRMLIDSKRFNEARLVCLDILHKEASSTPGVYHCLVQSCLELGLHDQAVWACRQFISNYSDSMDAHCTHINTLISVKRFQEGVQACNAALKLFCDNEIILNLRGECYYALRQYRRAVGDFHKTVEIVRNNCGRPSTSHHALKSWERCTNPFS